MFVKLFVSTLILSSTAAQDSLQLSTTESGNEVQLILQNNKNPADVYHDVRAVVEMNRLRCTLVGYEKRVLSFLNGITTRSIEDATHQFPDDLLTYLELLPRNGTTYVTRTYRAKCWCDDAIVTPCPEKCLNSCWATLKTWPLAPHYQYQYDCKELENGIEECLCDNESGVSCGLDGSIDMSNCQERRTEAILTDTPCSQHTINKDRLKTSYFTFANLLLVPLKKQIRELKFKLTMFKESVITTDSLFNFTYTLCGEQNELPCHPEATGDLNKKLAAFLLFKKNITMDMIKLQEEVEASSRKIAILKEQTFSQVHAVIKNYACCLKALNVSMEGLKCEEATTPVPISVPSTTLRRTRCNYSSFECDNLSCIKASYRCDGEDDCGDGSDERNC